MREFKFRIWMDGEKSDPIDIRKLSYGGCDILEGDVVEQFTGLQDKNGVDIYEGDIIQDETGKYRHEVYWCELGAGDDMDLDSYGFHFNPSWRTIEVIGNVHEHPHLLKEKEA